jgi:hypothetical protein
MGLDFNEAQMQFFDVGADLEARPRRLPGLHTLNIET